MPDIDYTALTINDFIINPYEAQGYVYTESPSSGLWISVANTTGQTPSAVIDEKTYNPSTGILTIKRSYGVYATSNAATTGFTLRGYMNIKVTPYVMLDTQIESV